MVARCVFAHSTTYVTLLRIKFPWYICALIFETRFLFLAAHDLSCRKLLTVLKSNSLRPLEKRYLLLINFYCISTESFAKRNASLHICFSSLRAKRKEVLKSLRYQKVTYVSKNIFSRSADWIYKDKYIDFTFHYHKENRIFGIFCYCCPTDCQKTALIHSQ